jgi:oligopeptide transport system substrate-binding protein
MKKRTKTVLAAILSIAMLSGLFTGCGTTGNKDKGEKVDTFTFVSTEPNTLNMLKAASNLDDYVFYLTSAMLYRSIDGDVKPELCDSMEVSEDKCTYTYKIKDATYSDGTKIKADDFVYYMIHKYLTSENSSYFVGGEDTFNNTLGTCEGIYTVDDTTFAVKLNKPITVFDGKLEIYPLQQAFVEAKGDSLGGTPQDMQYSGPYILTDWVVGSSMTFVKNDSYIQADKLFPTKNLKMVVSSDTSTTYSMYQNKEVVALVSVTDTLHEMMNGQDCKPFESSQLIGLEFNTTGFTYADGNGFTPRDQKAAALMKNLNFRKALCYAINRTSVVSAIQQSGTPTNRFVADTIKGTSDSKAYVDEFPLNDVVPLEGDEAKAKECLAAALKELGYTDVSQLPELSFLTFENASQKKYAETLVSLWKSVLGLENIKINLQPIQSAIMSMVYMDYDIYWQQMEFDKDDALLFLSYWETAGSISDVAGFQKSGAPAMVASMHNNEKYDALVTDCYTDFDDASRLKKMNEAEQMFYSDYVFFPVLNGGGYYTAHDYVEGYIDANVDNGYSFAHLVVRAH